jgi:hypothetical protein
LGGCLDSRSSMPIVATRRQLSVKWGALINARAILRVRRKRSRLQYRVQHRARPGQTRSLDLSLNTAMAALPSKSRGSLARVSPTTNHRHNLLVLVSRLHVAATPGGRPLSVATRMASRLRELAYPSVREAPVPLRLRGLLVASSGCINGSLLIAWDA